MPASRWIDVRSALRESVAGRLELRLNDPTESAVNRKAAENVPKGLPGRGITVDGLHFQTALPRIDGSVDVLDQQRGLEALVAGPAAAWSSPHARPVLVLPRVIAVGDLPKNQTGDPPGCPIASAERDLGTVRPNMSA